MKIKRLEFKKDAMQFPDPAQLQDNYFADIGLEFRILTKEDEVDEMMAVGVTAWKGKERDGSPSIFMSYTAEEFDAFANSIQALNQSLKLQRQGERGVIHPISKEENAVGEGKE